MIAIHNITLNGVDQCRIQLYIYIYIHLNGVDHCPKLAFQNQDLPVRVYLIRFTRDHNLRSLRSVKNELYQENTYQLLVGDLEPEFHFAIYWEDKSKLIFICFRWIESITVTVARYNLHFGDPLASWHSYGKSTSSTLPRLIFNVCLSCLNLPEGLLAV